MCTPLGLLWSLLCLILALLSLPVSLLLTLESPLVLLELVPPLPWGELLLPDELEVSDEEEHDDDGDDEEEPSDSAPTIAVGALETVRQGMILPAFFK